MLGDTTRSSDFASCAPLWGDRRGVMFICCVTSESQNNAFLPGGSYWIGGPSGLATAFAISGETGTASAADLAAVAVNVASTPIVITAADATLVLAAANSYGIPAIVVSVSAAENAAAFIKFLGRSGDIDGGGLSLAVDVGAAPAYANWREYEDIYSHLHGSRGVLNNIGPRCSLWKKNVYASLFPAASDARGLAAGYSSGTFLDVVPGPVGDIIRASGANVTALRCRLVGKSATYDNK